MIEIHLESSTLNPFQAEGAAYLKAVLPSFVLTFGTCTCMQLCDRKPYVWFVLIVQKRMNNEKISVQTMMDSLL